MGLNIWLAMRAREVQISQALVQSANLARAVAGTINGSFADAEHVISAIQFELQRSDLSSAAAEQMQPVLVNYVSQLEQLDGLFVYDAEGKWLVNSEPASSTLNNNSDREYFRFHRDNASEALHIGNPVMSRTSKRWIIPLSKRISHADGTFAGVVLATIDIPGINRFFDSFDINKNGGLTLVRTDGVVLARRPYREPELGFSLAGTPGFAPTLAHRSGSIQVISPLDAKERIVGFEHLERYDVIVVASLFKGDVLDEWKSATLWQSSLVLTVCVSFAAAGAYVATLIARTSNSAERLGKLRDELTLANHALLLVAREDGLTGLSNRRHFDESLETLARISARNHVSLSLVMIDVDDFKKYNDANGHGAGDDCLRRVAKALRRTIRRPGDLAARYGGEEFVLMLQDTDEQGALAVGEAARLAVNALQLPHQAGRDGYVSISVGIAAAIFDARNGRPTVLLEAADRALYAAKNSGKNKVVIASSLDP